MWLEERQVEEGAKSWAGLQALGLAARSWDLVQVLWEATKGLSTGKRDLSHIVFND